MCHASMSESGAKHKITFLYFILHNKPGNIKYCDKKCAMRGFEWLQEALKKNVLELLTRKGSKTELQLGFRWESTLTIDFDLVMNH